MIGPDLFIAQNSNPIGELSLTLSTLLVMNDSMGQICKFANSLLETAQNAVLEASFSTGFHGLGHNPELLQVGRQRPELGAAFLLAQAASPRCES